MLWTTDCMPILKRASAIWLQLTLCIRSSRVGTELPQLLVFLSETGVHIFIMSIKKFKKGLLWTQSILFIGWIRPPDSQ